MLTGRTFTEEEAQADARVAVVSEGFWQQVLGGAPPGEGLEVVVNGTSWTVVGVMRAREGFPAGVEIWLPTPYRPEAGAMRNNINYRAVARLADGATLEQAWSELDAIAAGIRERDPEGIYSWGVDVLPLRDAVVGSARGYLELLVLAVGLLLLAASANLAGPSLARVRRRRQETAIHLALGSGRGRMVRRVVVEHLLLAALGGGAGIALAWIMTGALVRLTAVAIPRVQEVGFDGRIAALGIAASLAAGLLAGAIPALRTGWGRQDVSDALAASHNRVSGGRRLPGAIMVGTEVALAVALVVAGGLLLRSFRALVSRNLGFEPGGVVMADLSLVDRKYREPERQLEFWDAIAHQVAGVAGVRSVALASAVPTAEGGSGFIDLPGREGDNIGAGYRAVSRGFFDALGIPILRGRAFDASDGPGTERVAVVSRAMADRYWPEQDPVGQRVAARSMESWGFNGHAPWITVVGVAGDVRQDGFESDPRPDMYVLYSQVPFRTSAMTLVVKERPGARVDAAAIENAIRGVDRAVPVEVTTLSQRVTGLIQERRLVLAGLGLFAGAALALVCLGIYGLMAFVAGERTREMAVRLALGARGHDVTGLMLADAVKIAAVGGAAGLLGAWALTRLLADMLVDVEPLDPVSYGAALGLLTVVVLVAALQPSLRVARQDPAASLRAEGWLPVTEAVTGRTGGRRGVMGRLRRSVGPPLKFLDRRQINRGP